MREQNIEEEVMEKRRVRLCRGEMTGGVEEPEGHMEGRSKRRKVKAQVVSAV